VVTDQGTTFSKLPKSFPKKFREFAVFPKSSLVAEIRGFPKIFLRSFENVAPSYQEVTETNAYRVAGILAGRLESKFTTWSSPPRLSRRLYTQSHTDT